jgi:Ca2+-binding RTX toxin-like protein
VLVTDTIWSIFNHGNISSEGTGLQLDVALHGQVYANLYNYGTISGDEYAINLVSGNTNKSEYDLRIYNSGTIVGDIHSEVTGNDYFENLDGGTFTGTVDLGMGWDTYVVRRHDQFQIEETCTVPGQNRDTVISHRSWTLGKNIEILTLKGHGDFTATGNNEKYNTINGNSGDNVITGGLGCDSMSGGKGADTFVFAPHSGSDQIFDFENGVDKIDLTAFHLGSFSDLKIKINPDETGMVVHFEHNTVNIRHYLPSDVDASDFIL